MNSTMITRVLSDNRIVVVRPCEGRFAAWIRQDKWSAWQGGFKNSEEALAWAESVEREVDEDEGQGEETP